MRVVQVVVIPTFAVVDHASLRHIDWERNDHGGHSSNHRREEGGGLDVPAGTATILSKICWMAAKEEAQKVRVGR